MGIQIKDAVNKVHPRRIAVAYLGIHWDEYVSNIDQLEAIVISPRLGTNPKAVKALVKRLAKENELDGWDRVFFHDHLHAKLYLGEMSAVFGSANLSRNGLEGDRLTELCTVVSERPALDALEEFFESVKQEAIGQYGSTEAKKARLEVLEMEVKNNPDVGQATMACDFKDYPLRSDYPFYVIWYSDAPIEQTEKANNLLQDHYEYRMTFAESDALDKDKWLLCWKITQDKMPSLKNGSYYWMRLDEVIDQGAVDTTYTKLVAMRNDRGAYPVRVTKAPFRLTKEVMEAFRRAYDEENLKGELFQSEENFQLYKTISGVKKLIPAMKKILQK